MAASLIISSNYLHRTMKETQHKPTDEETQLQQLFPKPKSIKSAEPEYGWMKIRYFILLRPTSLTTGRTRSCLNHTWSKQQPEDRSASPARGGRQTCDNVQQTPRRRISGSRPE